MRIGVPSVALLLLLAVAPPAAARTVYLNGIKLDDAALVKNQTFAGCDVRFDESGDVWITAKGVKVALAPIGGAPATSAPQAAASAAKFWVLTSETNKRATQYVIEVWVNGARVKIAASGEMASAIDVSKYVKAGDNHVHIVARKLGASRVGGSAADAMEIVIGQGDGPGSVTPLLRYKRTAAETTDFVDDLVFTARQ